MRIGVIGAGAIGGAAAALLAEAGHDVEVTARGANLDAIREHGLRLAGAFGEALTRVEAAATLSGRPDVAILATKATDATAALESNRDALGDIPLLVIQNGLGGERRAAQQLGHERVAGGLALYAANSLEPGVVTVTAGGGTYVGGREGQRFAELLPAGLEPRLLVDLAGAQWTKLVLNMVNGLPAITGLSVQQTIADARLRSVLLACMRETVRVGEALGVAWQPVQGLTPLIVMAIGHAPAMLAERFPLMIAKRMGDRPNLGSTLQSIRRGQRTEIDFLNGAVIEAAGPTGVPTPRNETVVELVQEVERAGAHLDVDEVLARFSRSR